MRSVARRNVSALAAAIALVSACGGGTDGAAPEPAAPTAEAAAREVCGALRTWTNEMVDRANAAAAAAAAAPTGDARAAALAAGFDDLLANLTALEKPITGVALPAGEPWARLRADLLAGPGEARAELLEERDALAAVGAIADDDERGRVSQFFNALEKTFSLVEPSLAAYADPPMRAAFADEPACRHVVQV
jgi:hypothetical protein